MGPPCWRQRYQWCVKWGISCLWMQSALLVTPRKWTELGWWDIDSGSFATMAGSLTRWARSYAGVSLIFYSSKCEKIKGKVCWSLSEFDRLVA
jgi:hypothetical protein